MIFGALNQCYHIQTRHQRARGSICSQAWCLACHPLRLDHQGLAFSRACLPPEVNAPDSFCGRAFLCSQGSAPCHSRCPAWYAPTCQVVHHAPSYASHGPGNCGRSPPHAVTNSELAVLDPDLEHPILLFTEIHFVPWAWHL